MEFLLVVLIGDEQGGREVLVDGHPNGQTHEVLGIGEGTYTVSLSGPRDYEPASRQVAIETAETRATRPRVVFFAKL